MIWGLIPNVTKLVIYHKDSEYHIIEEIVINSEILIQYDIEENYVVQLYNEDKMELEIELPLKEAEYEIIIE